MASGRAAAVTRLQAKFPERVAAAPRRGCVCLRYTRRAPGVCRFHSSFRNTFPAGSSMSDIKVKDLAATKDFCLPGITVRVESAIEGARCSSQGPLERPVGERVKPLYFGEKLDKEVPPGLKSAEQAYG
ncbi:hypothetical protein SKAU_G00204110 [Synaphobranchus kaupii]|uniref:Uncharacterized protein n=1 Tax=Synaphobranchus kaupii TaxID=118154 RepID=A0A9Q1FGC9_SYNKA|nr:hypothetical protein SKAU_G00204110 [Synaphobranchus kaupii]